MDEGVRADTTVESLARLRPAFAKDGTITAGSASQISDGAAAVVVMSKAKAEELGLTWLAEIGAHGVVAGPDASLQEQPANAVIKACAKEGIAPADLDLLELNEAFAAVGIVSTKELGVDPEKVNVNGGAIAMGHPVGMSGARIVLHLALELKRRGGGIGRAALCGGGGSGRCPDRAGALGLIARRSADSGQERVRVARTVEVEALVARAREGDPRSVGRLITLVEDGAPQLRELMRVLARLTAAEGSPGSPHRVARRAGLGRPTRMQGPRVGADPWVRTSWASPDLPGSASRRPRRRWSPSTGRRVGGSACWRWTRPRRSPAVPCSATGSGCRSTPPTRGCSSARWPRAGTWAGLPRRPRRPCGCWTPPGATPVLVETVGVGQSEVEVAGEADTTVVLLAPGMGDGIQAAKAGILEIGDVFVVNKADRDGADATARELRHMITLGPSSTAGGAGDRR